MQPESHEASQKDSFDSNTREHSLLSNHGLPHSPDQPFDRPRAASRRASVQSVASWQTSSEASSASSGGSVEHASRRLKVVNSRTGSPGEQISQYEGALKRKSRKKHGGPAFSVIQKHSIATSPGIAISDFPNGSTISDIRGILANLPQ